jgi:hypothetical protein
MADDEAPPPTPKRRDKAGALPFAEEDGEQLDGRAWNRKPLVVIGVVLVAIVVIVLLILAGKDLSEDDDGGGSGNVPPPVSSTTTTVATTTTTTTTSTTAPPSTTDAGPAPGTGCSPDEDGPDCIDPEGDGNFTIITGGGRCVENADDPIECADNDGDGDAGPSVLPT